MNGQLTIKYRCRGCGEHEVSVPYRRSDEDVVNWMRNVVEMGRRVRPREGAVRHAVVRYQDSNHGSRVDRRPAYQLRGIRPWS